MRRGGSVRAAILLASAFAHIAILAALATTRGVDMDEITQISAHPDDVHQLFVFHLQIVHRFFLWLARHPKAQRRGFSHGRFARNQFHRESLLDVARSHGAHPAGITADGFRPGKGAALRRLRRAS